MTMSQDVVASFDLAEISGFARLRPYRRKTAVAREIVR
jgi:hypothetical protein